MAGVTTAPAAVFAQRYAVRRIALAFVRLIITSLAVLALEGDRDAYISTGHALTPVLEVASKDCLGQKNDPPQASRKLSVARLGSM